MVNEIQYTSIKRVLDNLMDHPMLRDLNLEQVVRYTIRFIQIHGYNKLYQDKQVRQGDTVPVPEQHFPHLPRGKAGYRLRNAQGARLPEQCGACTAARPYQRYSL